MVSSYCGLKILTRLVWLSALYIVWFVSVAKAGERKELWRELKKAFSIR